MGQGDRLSRLFARLRAETWMWASEVRFCLRNRFAKSSIVNAEGLSVVSLTSYGTRIDQVYLAIESIAAGTMRPQRLVLWLAHEDSGRAMPRNLHRLVARGLEIQYCEDYKSHKKYYFAVAHGIIKDARYLVTADDDVYYPRDWLERLQCAADLNPGTNLAFRCHRIVVDGDRIAPYAQWQSVADTHSGYDVFPTGVGGVLYGPEMQRAVGNAGLGFLEAAPRADDVWLHAIAVEAGIPSRQIVPVSLEPRYVRGTQDVGLFHSNVNDGGNDETIQAVYGSTHIARIASGD